MPNLTSAQSLTSADLKANLHDIQDNVVAPILMRYGRHIFPKLIDSAKARAWLLRKRLVSPPVRITHADVARLRELREAIRALIAANHGTRVDPDALATLRRESAEATLLIGFGAGGATVLRPLARGTDGAVAALLGIVHEAQLTRSWPRLKTCRQCGYFFFDRSNNRSAAWCAMSICGNRTKNRTYRRRRAATR